MDVYVYDVAKTPAFLYKSCRYRTIILTGLDLVFL